MTKNEEKEKQTNDLEDRGDNSHQKEINPSVSDQIPDKNEIEDYSSSAVYIKNEKTGKWEIRNPSGSVGYNYLYRDDYDY